MGCGKGAVGVGCSLVDLAPVNIDGGDDYEENNDVDGGGVRSTHQIISHS